MKPAKIFQHYIWLVNTLHQYKRLTLEEISDLWVKEQVIGGNPLCRASFIRHKDAILNMFGIIIECDIKDGYRYYIYNKEELNNNSIANWLFSTLSVGNLLDENIGLQNRILLESIPSGDIHLKRIIRAMRDERKIQMKYQKYSAATVKAYMAEPYCVKLFKRRWYVLAKVERDAMDGAHGKIEPSLSVFALDRIVEVELLKEKFAIDKEFDAEKYFAESFGIMVDNNINPERIVLRAYGMEKYYLRSLPLHPSQREIKSTEEYADYEIRLRPTSDFKAHLLSRGEWLQVISPEWLATDIQNWHSAAAERYKKQKK